MIQFPVLDLSYTGKGLHTGQSLSHFQKKRNIYSEYHVISSELTVNIINLPDKYIETCKMMKREAFGSHFCSVSY